MKLSAKQFVVEWKINEKSDTVNRTTVNLSEGEVDEATVANVLVSGNSPRVKWQSTWRRNGTDGNIVNMTWIEWLGTPRTASAPETAEQTIARAKRDPAYMDALRKALESGLGK